MRRDRIAFLFGALPPGADPDDPLTRNRLLAQRWRDLTDPPELAGPLLALVAASIALDDPPQLWPTVQRLLGAGCDERFVMSSLLVVETSVLQMLAGHAAEGGGAHGAAEALRRELWESLPLPRPGQLVGQFRSILAARRSLGHDELVAEARARWVASAGERGATFGPAGGELLDDYLERQAEPLIERGDGPFCVLNGDLVVDLPQLADGSAAVHVLDEAEASGHALALVPDLVAFQRLPDTSCVELAGGRARTTVSRERNARLGEVVRLPERVATAWLEARTALVLRLRSAAQDLDEPVVELGALEHAPSLDEGLVRLVRAAYEAEHDGLPVRVDCVLARLLLEHPGVLDAPAAPFGALLAAAGLELHGDCCAHDESTWRAGRYVLLCGRAGELVESREQLAVACRVLALAELGDAQLAGPEEVQGREEEIDGEQKAEGEEGRAPWRDALRALADPEVLRACASALLGDAPGLDRGDGGTAAPPGQLALESVSLFAGRLETAARQPSDAAPARYLQALAAEHRGELFAAQRHLELAHEVAPGLDPVTEQLGGYLCDRGDAAGALACYRRLAGRGHDEEIALLRRYATTQAGGARSRLAGDGLRGGASGSEPARRHRPSLPSAPLAQRLDWLLHKATAHFERLSPASHEELRQLAAARAASHERAAIARALSDGLVFEIALHEGGFLARFLADRGPLLPDDEARLAAVWTSIGRSVLEVLQTRPGRSLVVRNLASAEVVEVRERTLSRRVAPGELHCGLVLPDGEGHQLGGSLYRVRAGDEDGLLDVLGRGDPYELLGFVGACDRAATG
ncbi:MAG TPA: hypothetical protein VMD59_23980 [Acidimicrobiales bacterium]|nr:hypothetical protein [Acidimicrobiales bacterium]